MEKASSVLIIDDDEAQAAFALEIEDLGVSASHRLPGEVSKSDLDHASLIIVDEYFESWPERDRLKLGPSLDVRDGIALAAVLRAHLEQRGYDLMDGRPSRTSIVLRTGKLPRLAAGIPKALWAVAVSGRYDLEWVLQKERASAEDVVELTKATTRLPTAWDPEEIGPVAAWLGLDDSSWRGLALDQIEACRPPWSTLSETSDGRVWLSWFLQRILPFSTFLVDDVRAAAALGLEVGAFMEVVKGDSELARTLDAVRYTGELQSLAGRRWWRAGIASLRDELLSQQGLSRKDGIGDAVQKVHGGPLRRLEVMNPVFTIDADYFVDPEPVEIFDAVRLQPDEWPSYADDPWLSANDRGQIPSLDKLVVLEDRAFSGEAG